MNRKRVVLGIFAVGFSAGALVLAGLQLFAPGTAVLAQTGGSPPPNQEVRVIAVEEVVNGERFGGEVRVSFTDPAELPAAAPASDGLFVSRSGDTLTLGTGMIEVSVDVEVVNDEEPVKTVNASYDGDAIGVVVTGDTLIYEDTTSMPTITPEDIEAGEIIVARTLAPGSLAEIGENMTVRVWGSEQNGQIVADILVYDPLR